MRQPVELCLGELGEVAEPLDGGQPSATLQARGKVSARSLAPDAFPMRDAATRPASNMVEPPRRNAVGSPLRSTSAMRSIRASSTLVGVAGATGATGPGAADQQTSAGSTSVATWPGGPDAAATAAAASSATVAASVLEWIQVETPEAIAAMSLCSGASYLAW